MKRYMFFIYLLSVVVVGLLVYGCGKGVEEVTVSTTTTLPPQPVVGVADLFNISGAVAIMSAQKVGVGAGSIKSFQGTEGDILKYTSTGEIASIFTSAYYHPPVTVIEKNPVDGSLYIGLANAISFGTPSTREPMGSQAAFFRVKPDGSTEVVDDSITAMGNWYFDPTRGSELPAKQVQFDSLGNIYYLGQSGTGGTTTNVLKKKSTAGTITQIGSSAFSVRDFLVAPNGYVLFHGSDAGSWNTEWLKIFSGSSVYTIFYNTDLSTGALRSYFLDKNNNIILVGQNLRMFEDPSNPDTSPIRKYSGVIRVHLNSSGAPIATEILLDDNNMYSETYASIGDQLVWGYWDPAVGNFVNFFKKSSGMLVLPLSLEAGVSEEAIRNHIRNKFRVIVSDQLDSLTFAGLTTTEPYTMGSYLSYLIGQKISGETWADWRKANGLEGIPFSSAKQVIPADDGSVYLVMKLDPWGSSEDKGDKVLRVLNAYGSVEVAAAARHATYLSVKKAKAFGNYLVYISERLNYGKILRLDLSNISQVPEDLTAGRSGIQIFSFNYNPSNNHLMYDVYDGNTNTSYLVEQDLSTTTVAGSGEVAGYKITDVVPFTAVH